MSNEKISVLGVDPSLRNWGFASGIYDVKTQILDIKNIKLITNIKDTTKSVRTNSKDLITAEFIFHHAYEIFSRFNTVFVEIPHGSQSARSSVSYGMCIGLLGALHKSTNVNLYQVTAADVKKTININNSTVVSNKNIKVSKKYVIMDKYNKYPNLEWPRHSKKEISVLTMGEAEHLADAIGAIEAGIKLDEFRKAVNFN